MKVNSIEQIDQMIAWEEGTLDRIKTIELFAHLVKTNQIGCLQGMYGRFAQSLITRGYLTSSGDLGDNYFYLED